MANNTTNTNGQAFVDIRDEFSSMVDYKLSQMDLSKANVRLYAVNYIKFQELSQNKYYFGNFFDIYQKSSKLIDLKFIEATFGLITTEEVEEITDTKVEENISTTNLQNDNKEKLKMSDLLDDTNKSTDAKQAILVIKAKLLVFFIVALLIIASGIAAYTSINNRISDNLNEIKQERKSMQEHFNSSQKRFEKF